MGCGASAPTGVATPAVTTGAGRGQPAADTFSNDDESSRPAAPRKSLDVMAAETERSSPGSAMSKAAVEDEQTKAAERASAAVVDQQGEEEEEEVEDGQNHQQTDSGASANEGRENNSRTETVDGSQDVPAKRSEEVPSQKAEIEADRSDEGQESGSKTGAVDGPSQKAEAEEQPSAGGEEKEADRLANTASGETDGAGKSLVAEDGVKEAAGMQETMSKELTGKPPSLAPVVRREIRSLPVDEQERFAKGLLRMMTEPEDGVEGSPSAFFRIAGYHGYPNDYCQHAQETFPAWHRFYLVEFEQALRRADVALGGDGNLGCPYWDWTVDSVKEEVLPGVVTEYFKAMPKSLLQELGPEAAQRFPEGQYRRRSNEEIEWRLQMGQLSQLAESCLLEPQHWQHASTRWGSGSSVENPHNKIHVTVGYPMSSVEFAAFDPVFWLHHCNVDRIHQRYLQMHPDSMEEMEAMQRQLHEQRHEPDRYGAALEPFTHPITGEPARCADSFGPTSDLLFEYDELPPVPPARQREMPVVALFKDINVSLIPEGHCYELHVFVVKSDKLNIEHGSEGPGRVINVCIDKDWVPTTGPNSWRDDLGYAGFGAVFARSTDKCSNCRTRGVIMETVDITAALRKLGIKHHHANLRVAIINEEMQVLPLNQTTLPHPTIVAPLFDFVELGLEKQDTASGDINRQSDVLSLQSFLQHLGYGVGGLDGWLGPQTETALLQFQSDAGVEDESGQLGPNTIRALKQPRMDSHPHRNQSPSQLGSSTSSNKLWQALRKTISSKAEIKFWVGLTPGYLPVDETRAEVAHAFDIWTATGLWKFTQVDSAEDADCTVRWEAPQLPSAWTDGAGGSLAITSTHYIHLDGAERWVLQGEADAPLGSFRMLPVLVHEIGHLLGLEHSTNPADVMFPFYMGDKASLSDNDVALAQVLYPLQP